MRNFRLFVFALFIGSGGLGLSALAQEEPGAVPPTPEERLRELEQKQKILERKLELKEESEQAKAKEVVKAGAGKDGFYLKSADGNFQIKLRGLLNVDGRYFLEARDKDSTTFLLRRVRPILEGTVFQYYDFRFVPDFAEGKVVLQDGYLDIHYWPEFRLRVGKFKEPVGLERLQSASDILFVERALPTNLVPNRELGVQLYGDAADGIFQYALGAFNGVPDGASADKDNNGDKDYAGRIFLQPFKTTQIGALRGLGIGVAGSYGNEKGNPSAPDLPSYKSAAQQTFFKYVTNSKNPQRTVVADGIHTRIVPQVYYYWGPWGLLGEYAGSTQAVEIKATSTDETLENTAWQVAVSFVLTGEDASYKGVKPKHPFDPKNKSWGAWEIAGRYSELVVDPDAFPYFSDPKISAEKASAWGVGLNGYLNRNLKFVFDYEETHFEGGKAGGDGNRDTEKIFFSRFQIAF